MCGAIGCAMPALRRARTGRCRLASDKANPTDFLSDHIRPYPGKSDHRNRKRRNPGHYVAGESNQVKPFLNFEVGIDGLPGGRNGAHLDTILDFFMNRSRDNKYE
jgi:hypothetical protein